MKCPDDNADLAPAKRDGLEVEACPQCQGLWLNRQELNALEDEAFHLGDDEKGTLMADPEPSTRVCPQCGKPMQSFQYRFYDLQLDYCEDGHGFWLDAGEDGRVLDLMKEEEARLKRSGRAEQTWASHLQHLRSHSIIEKVRDLFR
jgi:Zn-finger nucleic acid-binding protein